MLPYPRFGFVVGRSVTKRAVERNRVRRRLREIVRRSPVRAGWDLVLVARAGSVRATFNDLRDAVISLGRRAGVLDAPPGAPPTRSPGAGKEGA